MDTGIESYRAIIERVLTEYAKYPYSHGKSSVSSSSIGSATIIC